MKLNFCPKCKDLLVPKLEDSKIFVRCLKCDFLREVTQDLMSKEKIINKKIAKGVVDDKNIYATYENECKKCGYKKAQIIDRGVFVSDEDNLIFIKCGKCNHVERIGRRTS